MNRTNFDLVVENYLRSPFRSFGLSFLLALLASVLLVAGLLSFSLSKGLNRLSSRLGADAIVIPQGSEINDQTVLLQGDSKYAYLPEGSLEFIRELPDVQIATPQYYLTTLSSSCCDQKVSIIGFDRASDFVIQPWIGEVFTDRIPDGVIVVGSEIHVEEKKSVKIFGREYPVAAQLEPVGNKLDQAIFADVSTIKDIREAAQAKGVVILFRNENPDALSYSSILIKLRPGADWERLSRDIHTRFDGVQIRSRKDMFSGLEKSANVLQIVVWVIVAFILAMTSAAIVVSFSLSTRERRREYALLRILGFTQTRLMRLVLAEALLVSAVGTCVGLLFASVAFFAFKIWIGGHIGVPFVLPDNFEIAGVYVVVILLLLSVGPFAVYGVASRVSKIDAYAALREVEH